MDIAEIRKKAKAKQTTSDPQPRPQEDAVTPEDQVVEPAGEPMAADHQQNESERPALSDAIDLAEDDSEDGLERLFAASEELALATDESYAELLDDISADQTQEMGQYLAFQLGPEEYALDIQNIVEIIKVRDFTDIPRAPEYILGIISLRGVVVPIFDLQLRLNLGRSELLPTSRIIVCQCDDMTVGLLVDSINQVVNLADSEIEPPPGVLSGLDREMVSGIGRFQKRMIILLEIASVLDVEMS